MIGRGAIQPLFYFPLNQPSLGHIYRPVQKGLGGISPGVVRQVENELTSWVWVSVYCPVQKELGWAYREPGPDADLTLWTWMHSKNKGGFRPLNSTSVVIAPFPVGRSPFFSFFVAGYIHFCLASVVQNT